jgi:2-polyprenyl-3-methyl-5-hydroxy-6-metoxy-1,4-benzoquinol methylase
MEHMIDMDRHALYPYWELIGAELQASVLGFALSVKIFDAINGQEFEIKDVADKLGLAGAGLGHAMDILWSMGLLKTNEATDPLHKSGNKRYALTEIACRYFVTSSDEYAGDLWRFRFARMQMATSGLIEQIKTGNTGFKQPSKEHFEKQWASAAKNQLSQEQLSCTRHAARAILQEIPHLGSIQSFLDLGGGPGWVAIEIARLNAGARGVVMDLPEVVDFASSNIKTVGLGDRLSATGANIDIDDFGSGYDLVWCSSVLHFVHNPAEILRKIYEALRPGGVLVCAHAEVDLQPGQAKEVLPYYLPLIMTGKYVGASGDMGKRIRDTGFTEVQEQISRKFPVAPVTVVVGRKPHAI